jgi:hypothetical protein
MENMEDEKLNEWARDAAKESCRLLGKLARNAGVTQDTIAEITGYQRNNVSRLFSGRYVARLDICYVVLGAINQAAGTSYTLKDIDVPASPQTPKNDAFLPPIG